MQFDKFAILSQSDLLIVLLKNSLHTKTIIRHKEVSTIRKKRSVKSFISSTKTKIIMWPNWDLWRQHSWRWYLKNTAKIQEWSKRIWDLSFLNIESKIRYAKRFTFLIQTTTSFLFRSLHKHDTIEVLKQAFRRTIFQDSRINHTISKTTLTTTTLSPITIIAAETSQSSHLKVRWTNNRTPSIA